jgi:Cu-Zn family superoxide dismutase
MKSLLPTCGLALACAVMSAGAARAQSSDQKGAPLRAIAILRPTEGSNVSGTVTFTEVEDGVRVNAVITGLTPGKHGFHVHQFGDCSAADASSAGDHFNPTNKPHGGADAMERHVGDMGNVEADASGVAKLNYLDHRISLWRDRRSIIGRAVVVHANADDLTSQPSGNSGARVACGVIGRAKSDQDQ